MQKVPRDGMRHASVQKEGALRWGRWHAPAPYRGAKRFFLGGSGRAAHRVLVPRSCPCTGGSARERSKAGTERRDGSMHMHADKTRRTTAGLLDSCSRRAGGQTLSYDPKCAATLFFFSSPALLMAPRHSVATPRPVATPTRRNGGRLALHSAPDGGVARNRARPRAAHRPRRAALRRWRHGRSARRAPGRGCARARRARPRSRGALRRPEPRGAGRAVHQGESRRRATRNEWVPFARARGLGAVAGLLAAWRWITGCGLTAGAGTPCVLGHARARARDARRRPRSSSPSFARASRVAIRSSSATLRATGSARGAAARAARPAAASRTSSSPTPPTSSAATTRSAARSIP